MSSNNTTALVVNPELDLLLEDKITPFQLWLLGYDENLERVGKVALLTAFGTRYQQMSVPLSVPEDVADLVVNRTELAHLERHNAQPAAPILRQVSAAKARELIAASRSAGLLQVVARRVAAVGKEHALSEQEARTLLRRTKYEPEVAKQLALKGYRFEIGRLPKYVSPWRRKKASPWLAGISTNIDEAVGLLAAFDNSVSWATTRPQILDAYLDGAEIPHMMRGLSTVVIEDRDKWLRAVDKALPNALHTLSNFGPLRSHPYATDEILGEAARRCRPFWGSTLSWQDANDRTGELADYVLGHKKRLPPRLVAAAKTFVADRDYRWEFGALDDIEWPEGTRPQTLTYRRQLSDDQLTLRPLVEHLNCTFGESEAAWERFALLASQLAGQVKTRELIDLAADG